jgi:hypothetical protein
VFVSLERAPQKIDRIFIGREIATPTNFLTSDLDGHTGNCL